jgi:sodium/potassium-transporting ATPase subunit alpha
MFTNRLLLLGMLVEVSLQLAIVYSPIGQKIFGTAALPLTAWLMTLPFALLLFAADNGRKGLPRRLRAS